MLHKHTHTDGYSTVNCYSTVYELEENSKDFWQHLGQGQTLFLQFRESLVSEMVFYFLLAAFTNHWHECVDSENIHCQK